MKKMLSVLILMVLLLSSLFTIQPAMASNTTLAEYIGTVRITNNSTSSATNVFTVFNLTTADLISGDFVWQNVTNSNMETNGGADTEYGPAAGTLNAWSVYVPSIIAMGTLDYRLYVGGDQDMDGEIRYFAHPVTGMETLDNATLEPGANNFTIEQIGFYNTTLGGFADAMLKEEALITTISDVDQITTGVYGINTDFENYPAGRDDFVDINVADSAQTFTPLRSHYIEFVSLEMQNFAGGDVGQFTVAIRATTAGAPSGADLTSTNVETNTMGGGWAFLDVTFATPYRLEAGVTYAILLYSLPADPLTNSIRWGTDQTAPTYDGGQVYSPSPGVPLAEDAMFYEWGFWYAEATDMSPDDYAVVTGIVDAPDSLDDYAAGANVGVAVGNGIVPAMVLEKQTLTGAAASVTFSNIDTAVAKWNAMAGVTSRHLILTVNAYTPEAVTERTCYIRINGDSGNNYNDQRLSGVNAVSSAARQDSQNAMRLFAKPGTTYANAFGGGTILIPHAFNTTNHKAVISFGGAVEESVEVYAGRWANTNAVTSFTLLSGGPNGYSINTEITLAVVDERYLEEESVLVGDGTFDFNNITQANGDLVAIGYMRTDLAGVIDNIRQELNADAVDANYPYQRLVAAGAVSSAATLAGRLIGECPGTNATANVFGAFISQINNYADAVNDPHYLVMAGMHENTLPYASVFNTSGRRNNVAAITRVEYLPNAGANFKAGSMVSLYRVPRYTISRQELAAPAATISFTSIPQGYEALQLTVYARSSLAAINENVEITINTDAVAANYDFQELTGTGAAVAAARNAASQVLMVIPAANEGANEFGGGQVTLNQYSTTTGHKHFTTLSGTNENQVILRSSRWEDTSAITRIDLDLAGANNFIAGSVFELVGWMPSRLLQIEIDGDIEGSDDGNITVQDNANDWEFILNDSVPFLQSQEIIISSTQQQFIEWENDETTFTDGSGQGNDATPTFRVLSSNADVTAELIAFVPIAPAVASNITIVQPEDMIGSVVQPSNLFNETADMPGTPFIEDVMAGAGVPVIMFYVPMLMLFLCIVGLLVGKFSLLAQLIVMFIIIIAASGIGIPAWVGLVFLLDGIAFVLASKQFGW